MIAAGAVLLSAWWVGGDAFSLRPIAAAAAALGLAAFANAYNDVQDIAIDRVVHPQRPLPSGRLTVTRALTIARLAAVLGVVFSAVAAPVLGAVSVAVVAAMHQYSQWVKRHGLAGNVLVAVLASLPFLYGAWSVGRPFEGLPLVSLAIPLHLSREIAKDLDDVAGDRSARRTLPAAYGLHAARAAFTVTTIVFLGALAAFARGHALVTPLLLASVLLVCAAVWRVLAGRPGGPMLLKSAMICAMASLLGVRSG